MVQAVKTITSNEGVRHLDELLAQRHLVVWLGSGISVWAPSNLPNGQKVTSDLAAVIAAQAETPTEIVCQLIKQTAFEHIMERYPRREALTEIFARAYYPTAPNAVHEAFAHLINQGVIDAVVTTNYDAGLEAACAAICAPARQPLVIVEPDDAPVGLVPPARPVILKIHGCASPARRHTMVITLSEEGELEDWKRRWLQALITGRHLLVSGYSGLDFDLCAEMALLRPDALSWNSFGNPLEQPGALTDNAQRVIKAHEGTVLVGDMKEMLTRLTGQPCLAEWGEPVSFVDELVRELNGDELLDQWRSGLFNGLGCALAALAVARRLPENTPSQRLRTLMARGEAQFHRGHYFQSSSSYRAAAQLAQQLNNLEAEVRASVGEAEAERVGGRLIRAWRLVRRLEHTLPLRAAVAAQEKISTAIILKWVLLQRYPYHLLKFIPPLASRLRARVKTRLARVAAEAAQRGNWFDFQHCEMQAKDFGLPFNEVYQGTMQPLASREGFRQLGYVLAEMMAYRRGIAAHNADHEKELEAGLKYLELAHQLGAQPEAWKLAFALRRTFGRAALSRAQRWQAGQAWLSCEYTWLMRWLVLLRGE